MADDIVIQQDAVQIDPNKVELDRQMAIALGQVPPIEAVEQSDVSRGTLQDGQATVTQTEPIVVPDFKFDTFKEKFGYTAPDEILADIESLRAFKANPPKEKEEIKFENEQSEKLFKALAGGKQKEVAAILAEQERLEELTTSEITKDNAADIIKYGMQLKYKGLTKEQIDYKFNKQFAPPKAPVQGEEETDVEFKFRQDDWKSQVADIETEKIIEANVVRPELEAKKSKLVIPEIPQNVDQSYLDWKKGQEEMKAADVEVVEAYRQFKNEDVKIEQDFNDEANKIAFKMQYVPTAEAFKKAQAAAMNMDEHFKRYINPDGSPNRILFMKDMAFIYDRENVIAEAMKQAKNATLKAQLPDNDSNGGIIRQIVTQPGEESELDKQMRLAGIKR